MAKKVQNQLGIAVLSQDNGFGSVISSSVPMSSDQVHVTDKQRMQLVLDKRLAAEENLAITVCFGIVKMQEIQQHAATTFSETCETLSQIKQQAQGTDYQPYVDEFAHHLGKVSAQQLIGSVNLGGAAIAQEMVGDPYPPPPPPPKPKRTFLGRILLGDDR